MHAASSQRTIANRCSAVFPARAGPYLHNNDVVDDLSVMTRSTCQNPSVMFQNEEETTKNIFAAGYV